MSRLWDLCQKRFLFLAAIFAACVGLGFGAMMAFAPLARAAIEETMDGNRAAVYGTLASILGALLGFVITALSIAMTFSQDARMTMIRESKHYATMWAVFTKGIFGLSLGTIGALVGLIGDRDRCPQPVILSIVVWTTTLAAVRVASCVWLLEQLAKVIRAKPASTSPTS